MQTLKDYTDLLQEYDDLNKEALPTPSMVARMEEIEGTLYTTSKEIINGMFEKGKTYDRETIATICNELVDHEGDTQRDYIFSLPTCREDGDFDAPIGETLLLLESLKDSSVLSFLKVDDDEYELVYIYNDIL